MWRYWPIGMIDIQKVKMTDTKKLKTFISRKLQSAWICDCDYLISELSPFSLFLENREKLKYSKWGLNYLIYC